MQEKILLVEDDAVLNRMIAYNLRADGYVVTCARSAAEALTAWAASQFAMVLLDVSLPDGDGFGLCRRFKAEMPEVIVLFITAGDSEREQLRGYELGAVDYITKPFYIGALLHKIRALFNLQRVQQRPIYDDGRLMLDFDEQRAAVAQTPLSFTAMEFRVLALFCRHPGQVLTRRQMMEQLWDNDARFVEEHTLTATVSRIRGKLEAAGAVGYIKTVYGMGYQWMLPEENVSREGGTASWEREKEQ